MAKRRGNNEGSISKRKDGRWMGRYTVHTSHGPKQRTVYGKTRAEVAQKLTKAMNDRDSGLRHDTVEMRDVPRSSRQGRQMRQFVSRGVEHAQTTRRRKP